MTSTDPAAPLYPGGPTRAQLSDPESGWRIGDDLVGDYVAHVHDVAILTEVGSKVSNDRWGPLASVRARRAFRSDPRDVAAGTVDTVWPAGLSVEAWARHEALTALASHLLAVRRAAAHLEAVRAARLCVRCNERDGQYPADAERILLDTKPVTGWGGSNAPTWCRDCALLEVAALLDRVRAGASA